MLTVYRIDQQESILTWLVEFLKVFLVEDTEIATKGFGKKVVYTLVFWCQSFKLVIHCYYF
jgi:hypothetical protein